MAVKKTCLKCGEKNVIVTKKGFNAKRQQRWKCSLCNKTFVVFDSKPVDVSKKTTKKPVVKINIKTPEQEKNIKSEKTITTKIFVNSNEIKEVHKDITEDEAFQMVSTYFREVTKTDVVVMKDSEGNKKIQFSIKTGTKG